MNCDRAGLPFHEDPTHPGFVHCCPVATAGARRWLKAQGGFGGVARSIADALHITIDEAEAPDA
jgi:hypothetical protein